MLLFELQSAQLSELSMLCKEKKQHVLRWKQQLCPVKGVAQSYHIIYHNSYTMWTEYWKLVCDFDITNSVILKIMLIEKMFEA